MNKSNSLRIVLFGIGLTAVFALTGMNVYSLFKLHESTIESARESKKSQISDFASGIDRQFVHDLFNLGGVDMEFIDEYFTEHGQFPHKFNKELSDISENPFFSNIYFSPHDRDHCTDESQPIFRFNPESEGNLEEIDSVPELVCDGLGLARSRARVMLIDDYLRRMTYDMNRSLNYSIVNNERNTIVGHLNFVIDNDYLINEFFPHELAEAFGPSSDSGVIVWLRDWTTSEVLAVSDETVDIRFRNSRSDIRQGFSDAIDNWVINAQFLELPSIAASNSSLYRNLFVLGMAVFALCGALIFMYTTAKRERELAHRQAGFIANVTHELKTPLATMQAAGENIYDGRVKDGPRLKTYGNHIYNETIRLREMIDKLLDVARLDSQTTNGSTPLPQDLNELVQKYYKDHSHYVKSKGFKFTLKADKQLPAVRINPDHLQTILTNLVENAVKYSLDKKEVIIETRYKEPHAQLLVHDRGIGIPKHAHKQIFEKFYRVEDSMTARTKGHGLGLSIVKNLVSMNNGTIQVDSKEHTGSTFLVSFPVVSDKLETNEFEKQSNSPDPNIKVDPNEYVK